MEKGDEMGNIPGVDRMVGWILSSTDSTCVHFLYVVVLNFFLYKCTDSILLEDEKDEMEEAQHSTYPECTLEM